MNNNVTLSLSLYNKEKFALGKGNMNQASFKGLLESLVRAFKSAYGNNSQEYIELLRKDLDIYLLIQQKKVPNVAKAIVEHPKLPSIQIAMKGVDQNGDSKIEILNAPFDQNKCKSIIPYYNNTLINKKKTL